MKPLISIIIPTYNRAHLIGETLDSVLAQTYDNWECIVVDDGSVDGTEVLLKTYMDKDNRFQYHKRPKNYKPGGNGARNYGYTISSGDYVNWFDSDDLMHADKLKIQMQGLIKSEFNFSVCQTLVFEGDSCNILKLHHERIVSENILLDFIKLNISFLTPSALYKKEFLKDFSILFDEELKAAQEWEFICRVLYFSPSYQVENTSLVSIRKHAHSISYDDNYLLRKRNYYLARTKVFQFLLQKNAIHSNQEMKDFFKNYFITNFKKLLFTEGKKGMFLYWISLRHVYSPIKNIQLFIYICFVILTGRGYNHRERFIK